MPDRWLVVITGTRLADELQKLPDDYASFAIGAGELISTSYIFGKSLTEDPYHIDIIQKQLTRNITNMFDALHDEICSAIQDIIPATTDSQYHPLLSFELRSQSSCIGWTAVPALSTMENLIARASSRVFVGAQLCKSCLPRIALVVYSYMAKIGRDRDYLHLAVNFARDVSKARRFVGMFPPFLKPYVDHPSRSPVAYALSLIPNLGLRPSS